MEKKGKDHHSFGRIRSPEERIKISKKYIVVDYENNIEIVNGITDYCLKNNLNVNIMYKIANNCKHRDSHRGHKCYHYSSELHEKLLLDIKNNIKIIINKRQIFKNKEWIVIRPCSSIEIITGLNRFCKENNLSSSNMSYVADPNNNSKYHKGYKCFHYTQERYDELIKQKEQK